MPASDEARSPATRSEQPGGLRITRLVVGYDGSAGAGAAAAFALWLAGRTGCEATVVHAGPTPETVPSADLSRPPRSRSWPTSVSGSGGWGTFAKTRVRTAS